MQLAFLISKLAGNQLGYTLLTKMDEYYWRYPANDVVIFTQNTSRPHKQPTFTTMSIVEAFDFKGVAVATSESTATTLLRCPGPSRRLFYVWDLEWIRNTEMSFKDRLSLYNNPRLELVARSESHRKVIEDCWNTRVAAVIPDCNLEGFTQLKT